MIGKEWYDFCSYISMFQWKDHSSIWKGEGIYHLTFNVRDRDPLLGTICGTETDARVELTPIGFAISADLSKIEERYPGVKLCAKQLMPEHLHVVLWVQSADAPSIRQIAHGFRLGVTKMVREANVARSQYMNGNGSADVAHPRYINGNGTEKDGLLLDRPFIRTLSHKGQLRAMIDYVHSNPYRRLVKSKNPELFTLHHCTEKGGLAFRSMGNHWLLDWPMRQLVECQRSATQEDWDKQLRHLMKYAEQGTVTYSAVANKGESYIVRHIREAGYPVVILLRNGFPQAGSEDEKYYKPGGVYFDICAKGRLLMLESYPENFDHEQVIAATETALQCKAEEKNLPYRSIPRSSQRWRFIAGNEMLRILCFAH